MKTFFDYHGNVLASKSLLNRALIIQSFFPGFQISGQSLASDVRHLEDSLSKFKNGETEFNCGEGGTTLRFLALRVSRSAGRFILRGSARLFERPQQTLIDLLAQLGVKAELGKDFLKISSTGWKVSGVVQLPQVESSQFASAFLLSAIGFESGIELGLSAEIANYDYFQMTLKLLQSLGMEIHQSAEKVLVPANAAPSKKNLTIEPDMSSAFPVAVIAALKGKARLNSFPQASLQPDVQFVQILRKTGVQISIEDSDLVVLKSESRTAGSFDLTQTPDLFPVLACYLAFCDGKSILSGLGRLQFKESDRILKTQELLKSMNVECGIQSHDDFFINGRQLRTPPPEKVFFDADQDHRMVMAASIFQIMGASIEIGGLSSIDKSFPEYFEIIEKSFR